MITRNIRGVEMTDIAWDLWKEKARQQLKEAEYKMLMVVGEGKTDALRQANVRAKCAVILEEIADEVLKYDS